MNKKKKSQDPLFERLEKLQKNVSDKKKQSANKTQNAPAGGFGRSYALAFHYLSEFMAGILVGVFLGWGIDEVFSTTPLGLILGGLLGIIAGIWNMMRLSKKTNQ